MNRIRSCILLTLALVSVVHADEPKSRVILARDPGAVDGRTIHAPQVRALVAAGIQALTGQSNEPAAWRRLVDTNDVVGIKISTLTGPLHVTHREVIDAIAAGLATAGVAPTNILVWDRDPRKMRDGGWPPAPASPTQPYRVVSVIGDTGWDKESFYESKLAGKLIWGDLEFGADEALGTRSHLPALLRQTITKLINVPVLMDHDPCGIAGCLYNLTLGAVDNMRRFEQFGLHGDPAIGEIFASFPQIRQRLILNVVDALVVGYAGGPAFKPQYSFPHAALYFSRDPVAADAVCLDLLESKRKEARIPEIGAAASHIATAAHLGIGRSDRAAIEVVEIQP